MIPGTNPPPSIRTFLQSYGRAAAAAVPARTPADAGSVRADAAAAPPAPPVPPVPPVPPATAAQATEAAASTLNRLLRMYGFPSRSNGQTATHGQGAGP